MIVAFCGHREVDEAEQVRTWLRETVRKLASEGAEEFLLGDSGGFDRMAAKTVQELKREFPKIRGRLVLAYLNCTVDAKLYDDSVYPGLENVPVRFAISHRNRWMAERADCVAAYVEYGWGGAAQTMDCARRKHKRIIRYPELP